MNSLQSIGVLFPTCLTLLPPFLFITAFLTSPLTFASAGHNQSHPPLNAPQVLLGFMYLAHYALRMGTALPPCTGISLCSSSAAAKPGLGLNGTAHTPATLTRAAFDALAAFSTGAYLTSPFARIFLTTAYTATRPSFFLGAFFYLLGLVGVIAHTHLVVDARRKAAAKGKWKAKKDDDENDNDLHDVGGAAAMSDIDIAETIPSTGLLFAYITHPHYLCEWTALLGFALAAAPTPPPLSSSSLRFVTRLLSSVSPYASFTSLTASLRPLTLLQSLRSLASVTSFASFTQILLDLGLWSLPAKAIATIQRPAYLFAQNLAPPYVVLLAEVVVGLPRAWAQHRRLGRCRTIGRGVVLPWLFKA
ncbi:hypothetical protein DXG03_001071 [Asterophora parasitica]|uniref:Steroid 5-alpha reductase C-terminal domain-containing protein n=1 Tax=Asterophora parasitica TaxID=117018 RepID=A0A9P7KAH4_9AGAR|nr:hypothetical protein DXG03_001071 [Asterophora parasitica]